MSDFYLFDAFADLSDPTLVPVKDVKRGVTSFEMNGVFPVKIPSGWNLTAEPTTLQETWDLKIEALLNLYKGQYASENVEYDHLVDLVKYTGPNLSLLAPGLVLTPEPNQAVSFTQSVNGNKCRFVREIAQISVSYTNGRPSVIYTEDEVIADSGGGIPYPQTVIVTHGGTDIEDVGTGALLDFGGSGTLTSIDFDANWFISHVSTFWAVLY